MRTALALLAVLSMLISAAPHAWADDDPATALVESGYDAYKRGAWDEALRQFNAAREVYHKAGRRDGEALMLFAAGAVYKNQEKWVACIEALRGCRDLRAEIGDREGEVKVLDALCNVYRALADFYAEQKSVAAESGYRMFLADGLSSLERHAEAEAEARKAVALRRASGARVPMAVSLAQLALYLSRQGKHDEAVTCDLEAVAVFHEAGDKAGEATTLSNLGDVYVELERHEAAVDVYRRARDLHRAMGRADRELVNTIALGDALYAAGRWDASIETWRAAVDLARRLGQPSREASAMSSLGYVLDERGRRGEAEKTLRRALEIAGAARDLPVTVGVLINLGAVLNHTGRKEDALRTFREAVEQARRIPDRVKAGIALSNMGEIHMGLKRFPEALLDLDQALAEFRVAKSDRHELITLINVAALREAMGEPDKARAIYADALVRLRKMGMTSQLASVLNNLAALEGNAGNGVKALPLYLESLTLLEKLGREDAAGVTLRNIAFVQDDLGRVDEARESYKRAIERLHRAGNRDAEGLACYDLGHLQYVTGHYEEALSLLSRSIVMLESLAAGYRVAELKAAYLSTTAARYAFTVGAYYHQRRPEEAFTYAERAKARAFLDSLGAARVDLGKGVPPALLAREKELRARIEALRTEGGAGYEELNRLCDEYGRVVGEIALTSPESASLRTAQVASLADLQAALAPDEVLVAFFVGPSRTYAWALRKTGPLQAADFEGGQARVKTEVEDLRADLRAPRGSGPIAPQGTVASLVGFIEAQAAGAGRLVLVPHHALHYLPFGPLADAQGRFLADRWSIVTAPSASAWFWLRKRPTAAGGGRLVAYALGTASPGGPGSERAGLGPLPATRKEVHEVAGMFGASSSVFTDGQCVLTDLRQRVKGARYLHFATHGLLDARQPVLSALAMADGFLTVLDILGLDLDASLVTLSACDTAGGQRSEGDDVVGLTRAFLHAGAHTVVASLWKVPDTSTAALMQAFYRELHAGRTPSDALRTAQAEVRKTWPSPLYWGAFVVYGDGRI